MLGRQIVLGLGMNLVKYDGRFWVLMLLGACATIYMYNRLLNLYSIKHALAPELFKQLSTALTVADNKYGQASGPLECRYVF